MPRVQSYGQPNARTAPLAGARRTGPAGVAETAESLGAGIGEAVAGAGAASARLGGQVVTAIIQQERDRADQVATVTSLRQLNELDEQLLRSPDKGILNKRGLAAMEARDTTLGEWDQQAGMIASGLRTERQRLAFEAQRVQRRAQITRTIDEYGMGQAREHEQNEFKAFLDSSQQRAITSFANPQVVSTAATEQTAAITDYANRNGLGPETTKALVEEARNKTWTGVITQALAAGNDRAAQVYFEEARDAGQLTGEALSRITESVRRGTTDAAGERTAAAIWDRMGPKADTDAISLDKMETAARAELGDDTDTLKATIAALRSRKQGVDDGRRERGDARDSAIWGAVYQGKSMAEIRRLPEFVSAPGEVQNKIADYYEADAARRESRAASAESRAAAREQRAYTAEVRKQNELERNGWSTFYEISQPESLRALTPGAIMAKMPELGQEHVGRLLAAKDKVTKDDQTFRAAVVDKDLFNEVAAGAGFAYVYSAPAQLSLTQRANLGKLQATVEDEVARRQIAAGRTLTRDETRQVMQSVVDTKVMLKDAGWFYTDIEQTAGIVDEKNRASAYVPIDRVPDTAAADYVNWLRGELPALSKLSAADIKARYGQRLERAYALKLIGAKRAEIESALRGQ